MRNLLYLLCMLPAGLAAQSVHSENGYILPAHDTTRLLVIFAEVDCGDRPDDRRCAPDHPAWPAGQLPPDAPRYFDAVLPPGSEPMGYITDYYHEMSFGRYVLLGDYVDRVVTVPPDQATHGEVIRKLAADTTWRFAHRDPATGRPYDMDAFDLWTGDEPGVVKRRGGDGQIDGVAIFWRNLQRGVITCGGGLGMQRLFDGTQLRGKRLRTACSFGACGSGGNAWNLFISEQLHGLFGGNNFHTVSGAGYHTFMTGAHVYGVSAQSGATSMVTNGWERHRLGWRHPDATHLIGARDEAGQAVATDLTLEDHPEGGTFLLRDFVTTGDMIRVKLPHLNWRRDGDVKNQYLWLENHQLHSEHDVNVIATYGCRERWQPGLYVQLQVGKDIREGAPGDVFPNGSLKGAAKPNALGAYLLHFTAEGRWDYHYRYDLMGRYPDDCIWNNLSLPFEPNHPQTLPNPLTGFSDLYQAPDVDGDGMLSSRGDSALPQYSKVEGGVLRHSLHSTGDAGDAFRRDGNYRLNLGTNPAPLPVYTYRSGYKHKPNRAHPAPFENRRVHLNGLDLEILEENVDGAGTIKVRVRWDHYRLENDVRWCGDIVLHQHDFDPKQPSLVVAENRTLLLDRGLSPTYPTQRGRLADSSFALTDTTQLTLQPGAHLKLEPDAVLRLASGSRLNVGPGATFEVAEGAQVVLEPGAVFNVSEDATLRIHRRGRLKIGDDVRVNASTKRLPGRWRRALP
ncbi:MAG: hypothetical protein WBA12_06905 [Catalinimonas sp.]